MGPRIILNVNRTGYSSLWAKYVYAVDLDVHCIDSLVGPRQQRLEKYDRDITFDQQPTPTAIYLCGVTYPYRWDMNLHILATPSEGSDVTIDVPGGKARLIDLRPHAIHNQDIPRDAPHAHDSKYTTCRNWQAAWMLHRRLRLENMVNPQGSGMRYQQRRGQIRKSAEPPALF